MNKCTEKTERWPNALTDVSPDDVDAFLSHADTCPFHAEKLRAEDESLRSVFCLARGLDRHARILRGTALKKTIEQHERSHALWQDAARRVKLPFKRIYLSNCGEDIAGSGKFYDFRRYEGFHFLDLQSGLQIWGVLEEEGSTEEVLLGYYSLSEIQGSVKEELLPLENGYIVGLRVEQVADLQFKVEFRCVEDELLAKGRKEVSSRSARKKMAMAKTLGTWNSFLPQFGFARASARLRSLIPSTHGILWNRLAMGAVASCLFLALAIGYRHKKVDLPEIPRPIGDVNSGGTCVLVDGSPSTPTMKTELQSTEYNVKSTFKGNSPARRNGQRRAKQNGPGSASPGETATQDGMPMVASASSSFTTDLGTSYETPESKVVWYFGSSVAGKKSLIVHSGTDKALRETLLAEISQRKFEVVPLNGRGISSPKQVTARWGIIRQEDSVTVQVNLITNGEKKFLSFCSSDGLCPEVACEEAVRDAVTGVIAALSQKSEPAKQLEGAGR